MNVLDFNKEQVITKPGLSVNDLDTQCEEENPVGMVLREIRRPPFSLQGSETPTGSTLVEMVRAGTIVCAECGGRAQMRCGCGVLICLNHAYDIDDDPCCATCVASVREERHIQDDLTLEMYKNIARRR
jgi:hypothetical protein